MPVTYMGRNDKWFQENLGNGAMRISLPRKENIMGYPSREATAEEVNKIMGSSGSAIGITMNQYHSAMADKKQQVRDYFSAIERGDNVADELLLAVSMLPKAITYFGREEAEKMLEIANRSLAQQGKASVNMPPERSRYV